jgi:hypothetical protein
MAFVINPSEGENGNGGGGSDRTPRPEVKEGKKLVWAAGCNWGTSQAGNVKIGVRFVVVDDPPDGTDVRGYVWETFTLTQSAAWKLQSMARAVGQKEPWDAEDQDETNSVITHAPVWVTISQEKGNDGVVRPRIDGSFTTFAGELTDAMEKVVVEAEEHHNSANKMKGGSPTPPPAAPVIKDDDIPF